MQISWAVIYMYSYCAGSTCRLYGVKWLDDSELTLSVHAEYWYSAASHTSCLDGVLALCDFHNVLK
jgi:hypothetical protein